MACAAEIRMVHASSVDHVPIRVYGVNLSLHSSSDVLMLGCTVTPPLTAMGPIELGRFEKKQYRAACDEGYRLAPTGCVSCSSFGVCVSSPSGGSAIEFGRNRAICVLQQRSLLVYVPT